MVDLQVAAREARLASALGRLYEDSYAATSDARAQIADLLTRAATEVPPPAEPEPGPEPEPEPDPAPALTAPALIVVANPLYNPGDEEESKEMKKKKNEEEEEEEEKKKKKQQEIFLR